MIVKIIKKIKEHHSAVWLESDKLKFALDKSILTDDFKDELSNSKAQLVQFLEYNKIYTKQEFISRTIFKYSLNRYSLSYAQERLWFIEQYEKGSNAYHMP
ncbi:TubC N-terminal docking domain-related protein, partial [Francisella sciaenopsi]|uniref:TubC N-terminal docking domain-related protein n=1 Tax=Francisella sciaenopsi TaxID=3055034 RepID=UPI0038B37738